ncbi:MAG: sulfatase-like hydrolase/transferase [Pseudomonadota bacterium]
MNIIARNVLLLPGLFLLGLYLYVRVIDAAGGLESAMIHLQWLELAFVLYLYTYFFMIQRPGRWRGLIATIPVLIGYLVQDIYFLAFGKVFRLIAVMELPELIQVLPAGYLFMVVIFILLPLVIFLASVNYAALRPVILGALPLVLLAALIAWSPGAYTAFIHTAGNGIVKYSEAKSVESNGRYVMMMYREADRISALAATAPYRNRATYEEGIKQRAGQIIRSGSMRNVHLIVLESFLDPTLFSNASYSSTPVHPDFSKLFGDKQGLSVSPVFGGATAQAEFEILCGIPALEKLSSIEFNIFTGAPVYCLPGLLGKAGYRTVATNAYKPNFFNALPAYQGTGFGEIYFPAEYSGSRDSYFSATHAGEEDYLFDGALFEQNLEFVARALKDDEPRPLFNYIMAIYGHTPHDLDVSLRPEILQLESGYKDDHLQRAANQYYYRTQAITSYIRKLQKIDRNSFIMIVSDHVPPLRNGPNTYRELAYMDNIENSYYYNRLLIIENGQPVVYRRMRHFDLPDVVLDYITGGQYCRAQDCPHLTDTPLQDRMSYLDRYYTLMAHASE